MSKRIVLFCGPVDYVVSDLYAPQENDVLIGVDAGLGALIDAGLKADIAVGDFDSLPESYVNELESHARTILRLDVRKDKTDLAYALSWVYDHMDYDSILVCGGIGGRIDHFLANVNLLKKYDMTLTDKRHLITLLRKGTYRLDNAYDYVSFFAVEDVYDLTIKGFDYELDHYYLGSADSLCVSNRGSGEVAFSKGRLLVVFSNDR
jgi:thiamine pyrophosphokinase